LYLVEGPKGQHHFKSGDAVDASKSLRKSSPMPPRNLGARKMLTNSAAAFPTS